MIVFVILYFFSRFLLKNSQIRINKEIAEFYYPLMNNPLLGASEVHEYAKQLDNAFKGLDSWTNLTENEYIHWAETKTKLNQYKEARKLIEKALYINPKNNRAFWKLLYNLRFLEKEVLAIKYLDIFSEIIQDPGIKNFLKALIYESRYPSEARIFHELSRHEGINIKSQDQLKLNDYLESLFSTFNNPELLAKHKEIFINNLGNYWDFLTNLFPKTTILEIYYLLEKIQEKYGKEWLGSKQRFS